MDVCPATICLTAVFLIHTVVVQQELFLNKLVHLMEHIHHLDQDKIIAQLFSLHYLIILLKVKMSYLYKEVKLSRYAIYLNVVIIFIVFNVNKNCIVFNLKNIYSMQCFTSCIRFCLRTLKSQVTRDGGQEKFMGKLVFSQQILLPR